VTITKKKIYRATFADGSIVERVTNMKYAFAWKATPPASELVEMPWLRPCHGFSAQSRGAQFRTFERAGWTMQEAPTEQVEKRKA